jgi:phosphomannomutase
MNELTCFKAYDIRGEVGISLNEESVFRIGRAYAQWLKPRRVVVGGDARLTSPLFKEALSRGLMASGVDVIDIGMCGTEEVYFATQYLQADGGIQITASHNPAQYNGMKLVREQAIPVHGENGLLEIKRLADIGDFPAAPHPGSVSQVDCRPAWTEHLMGYLQHAPSRPLRIVVNSGHGAAGPALDALDAALTARGIPVDFIRLCHQPDGTFPAGVPNPMLAENRQQTQKAVIRYQADFGVAWDGDFDRCFFFDERGEFIESYYLVGLFAREFLRHQPAQTILLDPRLTWNTLDSIQQAGGRAIISRTGHAFIKARMRQEDALYGGEMSGHHYFRAFGYCDSGMIPLVLMLQILDGTPLPFSHLIREAQARYPVSGEINLDVALPEALLQRVAEHYVRQGGSRDDTDGVSIDFPQWRFNLRASNTEPLLRLNVESRNSPDLLKNKTDELLALIASYHSQERNHVGTHAL